MGLHGGRRALRHGHSRRRGHRLSLGASLVSTLRQEAAALIRLGARELDMVIPIGQLKSGNHQAVHHAIHAAGTVAHHHGALLKVILETALLTVEEKLRGSEIAIQAGADFIKTSPVSPPAAQPGRRSLMRGVAGARCATISAEEPELEGDYRPADPAAPGRILTPANIRVEPADVAYLMQLADALNTTLDLQTLLAAPRSWCAPSSITASSPFCCSTTAPTNCACGSRSATLPSRAAAHSHGQGRGRPGGAHPPAHAAERRPPRSTTSRPIPRCAPNWPCR
jgi:hypothetical protein